MVGLSGAPPHRGRIRRRLRVGPVDIVQALDVLIALIVFAADDSYLTTPHPAHTNGSLLSLFVAITTAAPLVLRDRQPLTAWGCSAAAIAIGSLIILPGKDIGGPYIPGAVVVYVLCLYAVAVRGPGRLTIAVATVTIVGAALIDNESAVIAIPAMIPLVLGYLVRVRRTVRQKLAE